MNYSKQRATWWFGNCYHKEHLDELINSTDIRGYAYILHDKDMDENNKPKKSHYHFLIQLYGQQRGSWFKQFGSDDLGEILHRPCYSPQGAYDYLIHNTANSKHKYQYALLERISTLTDFKADEQEEKKKIDNIKLRELILTNNKVPSEIILEHNLSNQQISLADRLYSEHMSKALKNTLRPNIHCSYLYGKPRTGKTSFVYNQHKPEYFYRVTNYKNPFDNYAYQKILVLDEYDSQLDIEYINNILDIYPCELSCRFFNKWGAWDKIYVISNIPLTAQYTLQVTDKRNAFYSRFHDIKRFDKEKQTEIKKVQSTFTELTQEDS